MGLAVLGQNPKVIGATYSFLLNNLGSEEKKVFKSNPTNGILVVIDAATAAKSAENNYQDLWNGKGDAYRHGLWQGLSAFHTHRKCPNLWLGHLVCQSTVKNPGKMKIINTKSRGRYLAHHLRNSISGISTVCPAKGWVLSGRNSIIPFWTTQWQIVSPVPMVLQTTDG